MGRLDNHFSEAFPTQGFQRRGRRVDPHSFFFQDPGPHHAGGKSAADFPLRILPLDFSLQHVNIGLAGLANRGAEADDQNRPFGLVHQNLILMRRPEQTFLFSGSKLSTGR